jgi:ABC-type multidrug transport system fused ATPase/permease subunit
VEQGTHRELLTRAGKYAELWNIQIGTSDQFAVPAPL